jgi:predicted ArsR family transcriptional regulator
MSRFQAVPVVAYMGLSRGGNGTVNELAEKLALTDYAARSHLLTLERDGSVRHNGVQQGSRNPHEMRKLFAGHHP